MNQQNQTPAVKAKASFVAYFAHHVRGIVRPATEQQTLRLAEAAYESHEAYDAFLRGGINQPDLTDTFKKQHTVLLTVLAELSLNVSPVDFKKMETDIADLEDLSGLEARKVLAGDAPYILPVMLLVKPDVQGTV